MLEERGGHQGSQSPVAGPLGATWEGAEQAMDPFWVHLHALSHPSPHPSLNFLSRAEGTHKGLVNARWFFCQPLPDLGTAEVQPQASDQGGNFFWIL